MLSLVPGLDELRNSPTHFHEHMIGKFLLYNTQQFSMNFQSQTANDQLTIPAPVNVSVSHGTLTNINVWPKPDMTCNTLSFAAAYTGTRRFSDAVLHHLVSKKPGN